MAGSGYSGDVPGENDLLQHVYTANAALPAGVTIPPGDDMAAVRLGDSELLVAVDQVADGVHFELERHAIERIGRKAVTRNLSDIAAMAARPVGAVVAATLPRSMNNETAKELFDAMRATGEHYGCPLIGGDISVWDGALLLSVTVFAEPAGIEPVRRGTAGSGDHLYVTGELGHSLAGHHLDFEPRLKIARTLAADPATRPTAMIDLSDGIAQDLPRLCEHAELDAGRLPVRAGCPEPAWQHALGDGEDYELLLACPFTLPDMIEGVRLTRIGTVSDSGGVVVRDPAGRPVDLTRRGWEHRG